MDRHNSHRTIRAAGLAALVALTTASAGCRSTRPEVPPGRAYSPDGTQPPPIGFSTNPNSPTMAGLPGSTPSPGAGQLGMPGAGPVTPYGAPTTNQYGAPGTNGMLPGAGAPSATGMLPGSGAPAGANRTGSGAPTMGVPGTNPGEAGNPF